MKSTQFILVRHGQTLWNSEARLQGQRDSTFTSLGLFQIERIAQRLASSGADAIYSSDLERAHRTAKCIADRAGCPVRIDERLRERNYGILEGLTRIEMKTKYPNEFHELKFGGSDYQIPQGESESKFLERCVACFEELARRHPKQKIIAVTHLGVLNCLFIHALGLSVNSRRKFKSQEGSLNTMHFKRGEWKLGTWGDVSHLQ